MEAFLVKKVVLLMCVYPGASLFFWKNNKSQHHAWWQKLLREYCVPQFSGDHVDECKVIKGQLAVYGDHV